MLICQSCGVCLKVKAMLDAWGFTVLELQGDSIMVVRVLSNGIFGSQVGRTLLLKVHK